MKAGAIILSGGQSRRMGTNKALLPIPEKPTVERIKDELEDQFAEMILVTNHLEAYQFLNMKMTSDIYPGKGPLAGIHAGLKAATHEVNLVVACDMPFVSAGLANMLVERIKEHDAVVPVIAGKMHPLFAVYRKKIISEIESCLKTDSLRMIHLFEKINVRYLTEHDFAEFNDESLAQIFFNMNHPEEYEKAKEWVLEKRNRLDES
ncbi:molybdenum cofactor guanylyltransferase [Pseudoneobacillus sp. C159]